METTTSFGQMSDTFEQRQFFANLELAKFQMAQKHEVQKSFQRNRWKTVADGGFWAGRISTHHHKDYIFNPTQL
jgi:hypothetical protein